MQRLGLKGSGNFRATYLYPAIEQGYVAKLYPESDKRPDQEECQSTLIEMPATLR